MRDFTAIQALLEKYWEGETTLDQERALKSYFAGGAVDERLRQFAPLFQALREEQAVQLTKVKTGTLHPRSHNWQRLAVAASIALLLSAGLWLLLQEKPVEQAIAETPSVQPATTTQQVASAPMDSAQFVQEDMPKQVIARKKSKVQRKKPIEPDAETDAAMEEIKAALALVSSKIGKGRREAAKGASHLDNMDRVFKKKEG